MSYIELKNYIIDNKLALESEISGYNDEEIMEILDLSSMKLPDDYLEFLRVVGKSMGPLICSDVDYQLSSFEKNNTSFRQQYPDIFDDNSRQIVVIFSRYEESFGFLDLNAKNKSEVNVLTWDEDLVRVGNFETILWAEVGDFI